MSGWALTLKQAPTLRVDLRGVLPSALAPLTAADVERRPVGLGRSLVPLAEFFSVAPRADDRLVLAGDLSRFDHVGWQMDGGRLVVEGPVGHYAGGAMKAGELRVQGDAGDLAACEMAGGRLEIEGDAGDFVAATLPGSMDGMRGGSVVIRGNAGARCGDRMRRGTVAVFGDTGDFLASRMVAGTIAVGGRTGSHGGWGMRRGSVVFAGSAPAAGPGFVPAIAEAGVFWQLLARDLALLGGVFAGLPARAIVRHRGDLAAEGKGEWIIAR
ncbi:MAG: formylmethanofuran dehydrogenase subunit C [Rubrivivax sp.]